MFKSFFKKFSVRGGSAFGGKKDPASNPPRDPVCGMRASDGIAVFYKDQSYAFCSDHCKQQFEKDPVAYIKQ